MQLSVCRKWVQIDSVAVNLLNSDGNRWPEERVAKRRADKSLNLRLERARRDGHLGTARDRVPGGPLLNHARRVAKVRRQEGV